MVLVNSTNRYSNSRYVVDNVTTGSPYTTIQSAINAAVAEGGNACIWIRSGTYTENLTLYDTIDLEGADSALTIIVGIHTPPAAGAISFTRCGLNSGTHILSSAAAGTTIITFSWCVFNLTNGYICNLTNWTGAMRFRYCLDNSTQNGIVTNTASASVSMNHGTLGVGNTNTMTANGNVSIFSMTVSCPILLNGAGTSQLIGASVFQNNIASAGTHFVKIAMSRIASGAIQAITHNSATEMTLDSVIVGTSNATAIGGTGSIKTVNVNFPTSNVLAGTITTSLEGVTRTAEMWSDNITRMKDTGFYSWAAAGPYFDDTTLGTFQLLVGGTGYIQGKRVTWVAQNYVGMVAGNTYFIYIDSTGTIGAATAHTDALYENYIVLFECLRDSTAVANNQVTVREDHPYSFQSSASNYLHDIVGPVIQNVNNGANITINGTQKIQINGADVLSDHGLDTTIPDSGGVGIAFYKYFTLAAGKWALYNATDTFSGHYNNAGVVAALPAGRYGVYTLYVSKNNLNSTTPLYFAVLDTTTYSNTTNANTAIANGTCARATNELALLEMAQLGYIIFRQSTNAIVQVTISKSTLKQTLSTGGTNTAALVNTVVTDFNGWLSSADTNVQSALDELDDAQRFTEVTAAGADLVVNRGVIANRISLVTLTLPAVAKVGDTIEVVGKGAGLWLIAQLANQTIHAGNVSSSVGVGGSIAASLQYDAIRLVCTVANLEFTALSAIGNLTVV